TPHEVDLGGADVAVTSEFSDLVHRSSVSDGVVDGGLPQAMNPDAAAAQPVGVDARRLTILLDECAPHRGMNDLRATREGLSVMPLGHQIYLDAKTKGDNSMSGKAGCTETIKVHARRDPDDKVKAELPEPE